MMAPALNLAKQYHHHLPESGSSEGSFSLLQLLSFHAVVVQHLFDQGAYVFDVIETPGGRD